MIFILLENKFSPQNVTYKGKKKLLEMVLHHYEHNVLQHPNFKISQVFLNFYNG